MTRGTLKIVTQRIKKMERLIHFVLGEIFGVSPNYHQAILHRWRQHGIYSYQPFYTSRIATIALFPYQLPVVHQAIFQMKFRNKRSYIPLFGGLLADVLVDMLSELADTHDFNDPLLLIVPSLHKDIRTRGTYITYELARASCKQGLARWVDFQPKLLVQTRSKTKQSRLQTKAQRLENPHGAYRVTRPDRIGDRNIILIDDVYTTGATLNEITRLLQEAGARRILRITVAH